MAGRTVLGCADARPPCQLRPPPRRLPRPRASATTPAPDDASAAAARAGAVPLFVGNDAAAAPAPLAAGGLRSWQELVSNPELHLQRAWSAEDAHVLRRKGHLKEQDALIEFVIALCRTHTAPEAFAKVEGWVAEHRQRSRGSTLSRLVPSMGEFFTPLPLAAALADYDLFSGLSRRRYVAPNFAEVRHVLNMAQVRASAGSLRLITFDADGTLYDDGAHFEQDNAMIRKIIALLTQGLHVGVVTAAGYPGEAWRFEGRLKGLLSAFRSLPLSDEAAARFHVMGGECNYLLRLDADCRLQFIQPDQWQLPEMRGWSDQEVAALLDGAERALLEETQRLRMPVQLVRKPRACGVVPTGRVIYEQLEEVALAVQVSLAGAALPFCAFNGGNDVFVDVGNKSLGLQALQQYVGAQPAQVLHVGDRFTITGNDNQVRGCCSILWVANPDETAFFMGLLLDAIGLARKDRGADEGWLYE